MAADVTDVVQLIKGQEVAVDGDRAAARTYVTEFGRLKDGHDLKAVGAYHDNLVDTADG